MSTSAIASVSGNSTSASSVANSFASLTSDEFVKVMLSELSNQDPFKPQDSAALMEQFSSLRNIESQLQLQTQLQNLVLQNQISTAGGMIGKLVLGLDDSNQQVLGLVSSVRVASGKVLLELDSGKELAMDRVTQIALQPEA